MEERKGDARVCIITSLFFICIISGGVFFCLYFLRPHTPITAWYPVVGIVLVAIPWVFWLLTYLYAFLKRDRGGSKLEKASVSGSRTKMAQTAPFPVDSPRVESPNGDKRRVHFGGVVVMERDDDGGQNERRSSGSQRENCNDQSRERPL